MSDQTLEEQILAATRDMSLSQHTVAKVYARVSPTNGNSSINPFPICLCLGSRPIKLPDDGVSVGHVKKLAWQYVRETTGNLDAGKFTR